MTDEELAARLGDVALRLIRAYKAKVKAECAGSAATLLDAMEELRRVGDEYVVTVALVTRRVGGIW